MNTKEHTLALWGILAVMVVIILSVAIKVYVPKVVIVPIESPIENPVVLSTSSPKIVTVIHTLKVNIPQGEVSLGDLVPGPKAFGVQSGKGVYHTLFVDRNTLDNGIMVSGKKDFYLKSYIIDGDSMELKTYKSGPVEYILTAIDPKIEPYIFEQSYCEDVSDCQSGYAYGCVGGFYNQYTIVYPTHGCYGDSTVTTEEHASCNLDNAKPTKYARSQYSGAQCIQNKCVATTRTIICEEGFLP